MDGGQDEGDREGESMDRWLMDEIITLYTLHIYISPSRRNRTPRCAPRAVASVPSVAAHSTVALARFFLPSPEGGRKGGMYICIFYIFYICPELVATRDDRLIKASLLHFCASDYFDYLNFFYVFFPAFFTFVRGRPAVLRRPSVCRCCDRGHGHEKLKKKDR